MSSSLAAERRKAAVLRPTSSEPCCDPCAEYEGSRFSEVWSQVRSDPYTALPDDPVTLRRFFRGMHNLLLANGKRTISTPHDLLPRFDKLIRPNGLCLSGSWQIEADTPYTGLLASSAKAFVIARASVAMKETRQGHYRSFGMAGKLFPSSQADQRVPTANFFVIDDNGGTQTEHYMDAAMTTHPALSLNRSSLAALPVLLAIAVSQRLSDSHTGSRQLYPLARAGLKDPKDARSPRFMKIQGEPGARTRCADFRDDLRVSAQQAPLAFAVSVRDDEKQPWWRIGSMRFSECVASDSCDHRLHFSHPRWIGENAPEGAVSQTNKAAAE
ncbi:MAG: hypothetical protein QM778_28725 [Myxococcales bacterium]